MENGSQLFRNNSKIKLTESKKIVTFGHLYELYCTFLENDELILQMQGSFQNLKMELTGPCGCDEKNWVYLDQENQKTMMSPLDENISRYPRILELYNKLSTWSSDRVCGLNWSL